MERCLYCYKELKEGQVDYHPACARKLFGTRQAPQLPYVRSEIGELAKQVVRAQTTLTGVQAKLSLDVNLGGKNEPDRFTIVGLWGKFILKPQTDFYRALPELEDLTMHMAEAAKIAVVPHGLVRFADGELGYITRRIDRRPDGGKIAMEDMTGGTFTISSLGPYGITSFSPIINQPELAILGVCDMVDTPVVRNGEIVIRPMMNLSLTADHRVIDGVMAAKFLKRMAELLENPYLLLI